MIEKLFKEEFKALTPYEPLKGSFKVKMDANESFLDLPEKIKKDIRDIVNRSLFNHYPDPDALELIKAYSNYSGCDVENLIAGNGSDELIQMIVNAFVSNGDKVLTLDPDFSMYRLYTKIAGGINIVFPLKEEFQLDIGAFIKKGNDEGVKLVILSNPNNPTGGVIPREDIIKIIEGSNSIVVIDEAYYEFYGCSVIGRIKDYENLIVLRTCSKAMGIAALRIGFLAADVKLINEIKKVKPPFNVNTLSQEIGTLILSCKDDITSSINSIKKERDYLLEGLKEMEGIKIYPTEANFILIKAPNAEEIQRKLYERNIWVRAFSSDRLKGHLRVSAGSREENTAFLDALRGELNAGTQG